MFCCLLIVYYPNENMEFWVYIMYIVIYIETLNTHTKIACVVNWQNWHYVIWNVPENPHELHIFSMLVGILPWAADVGRSTSLFEFSQREEEIGGDREKGEDSEENR